MPEVFKAQTSTALEVSQAENIKGVHAGVGEYNDIEL